MREVRGRRRWRGAIAVAVVAAVFVMVSGCDSAGAGGGGDDSDGSGGGSDPETYTVSYDANEADSGTAPDEQTKIEGVDLDLSGNTGNLAHTVYTYAGWNTAADGSGTNYAEGATYTTDADLTLHAKWTEYEIGDTGPAGGVVFYDKGSYSDGWRYLEAAPAETEWASKPWGGYDTEVGASAQGTAIGTGAANTQAIVAEYGANEPNENRDDYAAKLCDDLEYGGYDDWFLPSQDELNEMYGQREDIGGFASTRYWSSSETGALAAWKQSFFGDGLQHGELKYSDFRVRAARAF